MKKIFLLLITLFLISNLPAQTHIQLTEKQVDDFCGIFQRDCDYRLDKLHIQIYITPLEKLQDGKYDCFVFIRLNTTATKNTIKDINTKIEIKKNKIKLVSDILDLKIEGTLRKHTLSIKGTYQNTPFRGELNRRVVCHWYKKKGNICEETMVESKVLNDKLLFDMEGKFNLNDFFIPATCFKYLLLTSIPDSDPSLLLKDLADPKQYSVSDYKKLEDNLKKEAKNAGFELKEEEFKSNKVFEILKSGKAVALNGKFSEDAIFDLSLRSMKRMAENSPEGANRFFEKNKISLKSKDFDADGGNMMLIFGYNEELKDFLIYYGRLLWIRAQELDDLANVQKKLKMLYLAPVEK